MANSVTTSILPASLASPRIFEPITQSAVNNDYVLSQTADPAVKTMANCVLRGVPGTYSRFSAETKWQRSITDPIGEVFTPFASLRADAGAMQINSQPGVSNFINTGDTSLVRAMPTVGLEYRFPFIDVMSWGTQTVEPIAQIIARPNEPQVGKWPNEDAQSFVFDDSNLFRVDKFSGWDRVEGGGRANYGVQYTAQFNQGGIRQRAVRAVLQSVRDEFICSGRPCEYRARQRTRHHRFRLCRAGLLSAQQDLHLHLALPFRPRHIRLATDGT